MFGTQNNSNSAQPSVSAADVARINSQLTQVFVTGNALPEISVFQNGVALPEGTLESLTIDINVPDQTAPDGVASALLSLSKSPSQVQMGLTSSLFPGTVEIIAYGRRLVVSGTKEGVLDGLWLALGMRADGTASELTGVRKLSVCVSPGILGATLIWGDTGTAEDIFPSGA